MGFTQSARFRGGIALAVFLPAAALVGSIALTDGYSSTTPPPKPHVVTTLPPKAASYLGVFEDGAPGSYLPVSNFTKATRQHPNIALYFSSWHQNFNFSFARQARAHHAVVLVQMDPFTARLSKIAAGKQDFYLKPFADQVRSFRYPVIISFAHEMNGDWYPWGKGKATPRQFRRAWRHVVTVFRHQHVNNVTWLWAVHSIGANLKTLRSYWPGSKYVTWVGLDGYYALPSDNFRYVFGKTVKVVRKLTTKPKPVLISETAVGKATGKQAAGIANLFAGIQRQRLLGMVWFDRHQIQDVHHQDWRLEGKPGAMAAFIKAASGYHLTVPGAANN
jgi:mannan endo-1,4-beta-mannosidase